MASVRAYLAAERSENTRRAYATDWRDFQAWCERAGEQPLPASPASVARYIAQLADRSLATTTIVRRAAAIRAAHRAAGHDSPTAFEGVKATLRGIRRIKGTAPKRRAAPAVAAAIAAMLARLPDTLTGIRDRAILLIGFAAGLRRSELAGLMVTDIEPHRHGILLHIGRSKTDQEGRGAVIPVPTGKRLMPVAALTAWREAARISDGPLFRPIDRHGRVGACAITDRSIGRIVKAAAAAAGLEPSIFSGHSLRAGFITQALADGVDFFRIMDVTRHRETKTLRIYDRRESGFDKHAGAEFL